MRSFPSPKFSAGCRTPDTAAALGRRPPGGPGIAGLFCLNYSATDLPSNFEFRTRSHFPHSPMPPSEIRSSRLPTALFPTRYAVGNIKWHLSLLQKSYPPFDMKHQRARGSLDQTLSFPISRIAGRHARAPAPALLRRQSPHTSTLRSCWQVEPKVDSSWPSLITLDLRRGSQIECVQFHCTGEE